MLGTAQKWDTCQCVRAYGRLLIDIHVSRCDPLLDAFTDESF